MAWSGVPVLAYRGFPPTLLNLQALLGRQFPTLPPASPGSRWPKTTLGALKPGKSLRLEEVQRFWETCQRFKSKVQELPPLSVQQLHWVQYRCMSLEEVATQRSFALQAPTERVPPPAWQRAFVEEVLAPFSSPQALEAYFPAAAGPGHRSDYYRQKQTGETLVYRLSQVPELVTRFQEAIDEALPGTYDWFETRALHVTLRGL